MKIHPTAIISEKSKIDNSVEVGPFCIIDAVSYTHLTMPTNREV